MLPHSFGDDDMKYKLHSPHSLAHCLKVLIQTWKPEAQEPQV